MAKYFFFMVFFMKAWPKHVEYYELNKKELDINIIIEKKSTVVLRT